VIKLKTIDKGKQKDWLELCDYVHKEILEYEEDMKFPKKLALRLKGLSSGQFLANNTLKPQANEYKTILYTFKIYKTEILQAVQRKCSDFKSEEHKWNYVMAIVENKINDVVIMLKKNKKSMQKTENIDTSNHFNNSAEYKKKTIEKKNSTLNKLW